MFGQDQKGSHYKTIDEMWEVQMNNKKPTYKVIDPVGSIKNWYRKANQYWTKAEATYDGVLNGHGNLSEIDIQGSEKFLNQLKVEFPKLNFDAILDCGAGIGRVSKELFCRYFKNVDIIDQCQKYIRKARQILKGTTARHYYCNGLQDFNFNQKYDIIWIQWVLSHLTDQDAVIFFQKAKNALNQNGMIVLKENYSEKGFLVDKQDYSVIRSDQMYRNLIQRAGLRILKQKVQERWPDNLFNVKMYALI